MTPRDIVIVGTGGSGRETLAVLRDVERVTPGTWRVRGFLGVQEPDHDILSRLGIPFLGSSADLPARHPESTSWAFAVGIGDCRARRHEETALLSQGLEPVTLIQPTVQLGPDVDIGRGSVVCANATITTNVRLGRSVQVNVGCVIGHDARVGDYVTFAQGVNVGGNVTIDDDATLFTGAILLPGTTIGAGAIVGAGTVVTRDVRPGQTVVGVPGHPVS